ncbi:hypothetical protein L2Y94_02685 [Luteibacter aegosomatis]|uniref:hypothetical protein n=1 Tax=Luteibacter aegosomatis TaxID=2911537 RepID=UPI001FFAEA4D|nr:hypothetical protein [Luteibacter aegosomatis]UPG86291.1 hypothetical protein L2Y94_02685 [Luteibacter aegosomatis]
MQVDLTAISIFACITLMVRSFIDAWSRRRLLRAAGSDDLLRTFMLGEDRQRRLSSLYWGIVAVALAAAFAAIGTMDTERVTPAAVAAVLAAVGVANLAFFGISRRLS